MGNGNKAMTRTDFELFKAHILKLNPYFDTGYANAFKDGISDAIKVRQGKDFKDIFPADNVGNFFYLRNEPNISYTASRQEAYSDVKQGRLAFQNTNLCYLVAVVDDADDMVLINNLINTCMMYGKMSVIPTQSIWLRENVVVEELDGFSEDVVMRVLQRLKNETIIRLTLNVQSLYLPDTCIENPCKSC